MEAAKTNKVPTKSCASSLSLIAAQALAMMQLTKDPVANKVKKILLHSRRWMHSNSYTEQLFWL